MCVCACVSTCASGEHLCGAGGQQVSLRVMTTCVQASGRWGGRWAVCGFRTWRVSLWETKLRLKLWEKL